MSDIDIVQLISDMKSAASQIIGKDVSQIRGFAEEQLQAIARQADFVAAGVAEGSIDESLRDFFLDSIQEMVRSFVNTLAGLITITIEKVWNAIVGVIWAAINKATGLSLIVP